ncbi:hypothetical protein CEXT_111761 [Caerostris extrusa]|uniref:Secreted protein n=1 Tax=Caerostris extrusa TaxID=172846 RepID=A0AAV4PZ71_CAEEX|nr:hypothetical protein CEXT_111761 [Caerostris extrusa]
MEVKRGILVLFIRFPIFFSSVAAIAYKMKLKITSGTYKGIYCARSCSSRWVILPGCSTRAHTCGVVGVWEVQEMSSRCGLKDRALRRSYVTEEAKRGVFVLFIRSQFFSLRCRDSL